MRFPPGRRLLAFASATWVLVASVANASAVLNLVGLVEGRFGGVAGLDGPISVAVSPDGAHVYATGGQTVAVFERDPVTGLLTLVETQVNGAEGVEGLNGVASVAVSPDGLDVYVAGLLDDAVVTFNRNNETGRLTFVRAQFNGDGGIEGIDGPASLAISFDGQHVYAASSVSHSVALFARDVETGELAFVDARFDGVDGVDGLAGAGSVIVSPDGFDVYVSAYLDEAVAVFGRDRTTGELTFVEAEFEGAGGVSGLVGATFLDVSPNPVGDAEPTSHLYVAGFDGDSVAVFARDLGTGELSFVQSAFDSDPGIEGLDGPTSVRVSPDGTTVYVSSCFDAAVVTFSRNAPTGELTFLEATAPAELSGEQSLAISPDGNHVYVADNGGVAVLAVDPGTGGLTFADVDTSVFDGPGGGFLFGVDGDYPPNCVDGLNADPNGRVDDPDCASLWDDFDTLHLGDGLDGDARIDERAPSPDFVAEMSSGDPVGRNDIGDRGHWRATGDSGNRVDGEVGSDDRESSAEPDRSGFFEGPHPIVRGVTVALTPLLAVLVFLNRAPRRNRLHTGKKSQ